VVDTDTSMCSEARSAPAVVAGQLANNEALAEKIGQLLRERQPQVVVTCARGSSDHAATYAKYLIETFAGTPTASFAPSVSSVYAAKQNMQGAVFLALSQSGKSPDLLKSATAAKKAGALVIALVNVVDSPLAKIADEIVPLHAGVEKSVAATKSYIATLSALVQLVKDANNFFVIGRGVGLGIAQEAALKFKEAAGLHAEAYSAAEVRHGPMAIVKHGFPVLLFTQDDGTRAAVDLVVEDFSARGAIVLVAGKSYDNAVNLPSLEGVMAATMPIVFIQSFYRMLNELAITRGYDPDSPPHLRKVTETV